MGELFGGAFDDLLNVAWNILGIEGQISTEQAIKLLFKDANLLASLLVEFLSAVFWWAAHLGTATSELAGYLDEAATHLNDSQDHHLEAWQTFLDDKYPADLRDLYDKLSAKALAQGKANLKPIEEEIAKLQRDDRAEQTWQDKIATPALNAWEGFSDRFKRTYAPPLATLIDWLAQPSRLADFALPALIAALPAGLRKQSAQMSAGAIERALVDTWQDAPNPIWESMLRFLVAGS